MAWYRQGSGTQPFGSAPFGSPFRASDHETPDQKLPVGGRHGNSSRHTESSSRVVAKPNRGKRSTRTGRLRSCGTGMIVFLLLCVVIVTILGGDYLFSVGRTRKGQPGSFRSHDFFDDREHLTLFSLWKMGTKTNKTTKDNAMDWESDIGNAKWKRRGKRERALQFGKAFVGNEKLLDRDSRDWDKDDRRRDRDLDYGTDAVGASDVEKDDRLDSGIEFTETGKYTDTDVRQDSETHADAGSVQKSNGLDDLNKGFEIGRNHGDTSKLPSRSGGLYNERGRKELRRYEEEFEADLSRKLDASQNNNASDLESRYQQKHDKFAANSVVSKFNDEANASTMTVNELKFRETSRHKRAFEEENGYDDYDDNSDEDEGLDETGSDLQEDSSETKSKDQVSDQLDSTKALNEVSARDNTHSGRSQSLQKRQRRLSRRAKRRRRAGYPCEIDFRETTRGLIEPEFHSTFANFSLKYIDLEDSQGVADWVPRFAGHQSLQQREQSFLATDQSIHCGFVNEAGSSKSTGFDMAEEDVQFLSTCRIAVSSCIFGSSDNVRSPRGRKLTGSYKKDVCFVMFVDQGTLDVIKEEGQGLDDKGYLGPWKVIIVKNMPYTDARRIGKIPKLLTHRLFPSARYSIWLDSKLRLQSDPVLILEYFLWRGGYEYAISNHYDRHCVSEEVQQNKKLNKYNHSVIDEQYAFYKADGLTRFNASDPKKLLPSYVPEGSFIIRAHTPMSNLFSCLWFNEVDRFTPRDQLSFAYTYMKLVRTNPNEHFYLNMFKDCERKTIAKLFRHRKNVSNVT